MRSAIATNQQALLRDEPPAPTPTPQPTTRTTRQAQQAQQQAQQPITQSRNNREDTRINNREEEVEYTPPPPRVSHKLLPSITTLLY